MTSALVVLAAVAAGMIVVESQLFPGLIDEKPGLKEIVEGGLPRPTAPIEIDDGSKKEEPLFKFDRRDNETEAKKWDGDRYFWSRDLGAGENVSERAFAPNGSSVIVVKSRDRSLDARNITRATSVYNFFDTSSLVAIIPWGYYGPCLIRNTTLTYPGAIDMLAARNGSSFQPTIRQSIDANVAPLSSEETATFLVANPYLRRWCSFRPIIITVDLGGKYVRRHKPTHNPTPYSNSTEEIVTLLLEADINIIIPERPETPDTPQTADVKTGSQRSIDQGVRWGYARDLLLGQGFRQPQTVA